MIFSCKDEYPIPDNLDFKQEMRNFVQDLSEYSKNLNSGFFVIAQNGQELISIDGENTSSVNETYVSAIDGQGREDLLFGYNSDNEATPTSERDYILPFLNLGNDNGVTILVTDYCSDHVNMDFSYTTNNNYGFISFAADQRELNNIPNYPSAVYGVNSADIFDLSECKNFLYLINPELYSTKQAFIDAVKQTNYDLIIMDLFFNDGSQFSLSEIQQLQIKQNGGKRLVISYMSIGEAEDYRYYWQTEWKEGDPFWIEKENRNWEGNYIVRYWEQEWKKIIFGNDNSYLKKIVDAGFDGVYLDIIDGYEFFE